MAELSTTEMRELFAGTWSDLAIIAEILIHARVATREEFTILLATAETKETPNYTSAAVGIGGCGIILDAGAAENGLRR